MVSSRSNQNRARPGRSPQLEADRWRLRIAALLLLLIPFGIAGGLMAPGFVDVAQHPASDASAVVADESPRVELDHEPLRKRDYSVSLPLEVHMEVADLSHLFSEGDAESRRDATPRSVPRYAAPIIALDEIAPSRRYVDFEDMVPPAQEPAEREDDFLAGDDSDDDFGVFIADLPVEGGAQPPVVPEPGTALLLGTGLAGLSAAGGRRRGSGRENAGSSILRV